MIYPDFSVPPTMFQLKRDPTMVQKNYIITRLHWVHKWFSQWDHEQKTKTLTFIEEINYNQVADTAACYVVSEFGKYYVSVQWTI